MADGLKLLLKEDFKPKTYDWYAYMCAVGGVRAVLLVFAWCVRRRADPGQLFPGWPAGSATAPTDADRQPRRRPA